MPATFSSFPIPAFVFLVLCISNGVLSGPEHWSACSDSCPSLLSNHSCPIVNGTCQCQRTNASNYCDPVDQRLLTNLTGAWQKNTTDCCHCNSSQQYCCQRCNSTATPTTATSVPRDYFRALILFVLDCTKYNSQPQSNFTESFTAAMSDVTNVNPTLIIVHDRICVSGNTPYCGVDVEEIRAHHRARRLAGGRARPGGGGKKSDDDDDDNNDNNYSNNIRGTGTATKCGGYAVNLTMYADENALELLRKRVTNGSLVLSTWNGDIFASFVLSAVKGGSYKLHMAPVTLTTKAPLEIPPLETNMKPMMIGFGASLFLLFLFLLYRCIKHSVLLKQLKFTDINSDQIAQKMPTPVEVVKTKEEQEEEESKAKEAKEKERMGPSYDMTHTSIPYVTNDSLRRYDWTSPAYLPSMLAPASRTNALHGQSRPRLILDDIESEDENCSDTSDVNVDEDNILCDELNSDDESSSTNVQQAPPRSVSSLYRKSAAPARSTTRQGGARSSLDVARPATAQSACGDIRPSSAQSRKVPTPAVEVREDADITGENRSASEARRPSTFRSPSATQRPSSTLSVTAAIPPPAMEEEAAGVEDPDLENAGPVQQERPPTALSVNEEQRPRSALSSSRMNQASSLPPVG